ncbi:MAG: nucleoside monophosphate kinase [Thermoguttaceae bacterium]|nr:nucleoside monophosphate kinase [Thermoguttaceae bacterium]MDW8078545.1 nucleoside monophosphate kinase [Thermoguttaceae bacterium]
MLPHDPALLLIGPTGSGKTPLGDELARLGILGRRAVHFDFGESLRRSVRRPEGLFSPVEVEFLRTVLESGALLEPVHYPLAIKVLNRFCQEQAVGPGEWVVLNGLPRDRAQADFFKEFVTIRAVIELVCPAEVVLARIRSNVGGDRAGRPDDYLPKIINRLRIYEERTRPLVDWYRTKGIAVVQLPVGPETRSAELADQVLAALSAACPRLGEGQ